MYHLATKLKPLTDKEDITPDHDATLMWESLRPDIHVEISFKTLKLMQRQMQLKEG